MIPAPFDYIRAGSVEEAVGALSEHGWEAKLLAGGHSLLPLMKLRLAVPSVLVDIGRIDDLRGIRNDDGHVVIGALTTIDQLHRDEIVRRDCRIVSEVAAVIGDPQVRHRGTIGGSLAHGDAAGDLPAVMLALDAEFVAEGPGGRRTIPAGDFFQDYLETALADDEMLVEVRIPKLGNGWGWNYQKFNRVAQAWAIVGCCALVRRSNGSVEEARVGLTHMDTVPLRASATEEALRGASLDAIPEAAQRAADDTSPPDDLNADPDFRRHLARVLTRRALEQAVGAG
ncbi:MAG: xanthine dehydrogenase family protein subunit M [Nitriliruptorales bacterium]|nr:xanthine dehydrogenase family protein subunit M [Nitriliruptorales bacterium]